MTLLCNPLCSSLLLSFSFFAVGVTLDRSAGRSPCARLPSECFSKEDTWAGSKPQDFQPQAGSTPGFFNPRLVVRVPCLTTRQKM